MIDIYHSRRTKHKLCYYYIRDEKESVGDLSKWVLQRQPSGVFYAQEATAKSDRNGQVNNVFMHSESMVNIVTNDEIDNITSGSVVMYLGHAWLVNNVQREIHNNESEFGGEHRTTYLSLTR